MMPRNRWFLELLREESQAQLCLRTDPDFKMKPKRAPYDHCKTLERVLR